MAIKLVDELKAMGNFPIAHAEGINLVKTDGTEDNLQNLFDNGELGGGGGDSSVTLTQQEYEALSEEQKLNGLYYTYDTKRIYKNGVQYGASDAEGIGYNNAESGIQATTVQGAIDDNSSRIAEVETELNAKLNGLINDTKVTTTNTFSSDKIKAITNELRKFILSKTDYQGIETYPTECGVYRVTKKIDGIPNDASQYATLIIYGNGYFTHIYHDAVSGRMWIGYTADSVKAPAWHELATMDKVAKYPDWSNQQTISMTEITVDQDVYIELNQLNSSPMEALKINGKDVSVSDSQNELYSTRFSGYVKKGSVVSYPYLTDTNVVRVFPLV